MEGDYRRHPEQAGDFIAGRPRQMPSHRPPQPHVTDLRPQARAHNQKAHQPIPVSYQSVDKPSAAAPAHKLSTAELIAQHERETARKPGPLRNLKLAVLGLVLISVVALVFLHRPAKKPAGPFPSTISQAQVGIPVYYPAGLAAGFKVSNYKVVKQNVLNYVVTNQNNDSFYVNIQAVPSGYDFAGFNKRFTKPATYQTSIGTATIGGINNALICSIQTKKSWILINTTAINDNTDMAAIAKSLKPASL